jgi:hypothetical protein
MNFSFIYLTVITEMLEAMLDATGWNFVHPERDCLTCACPVPYKYWAAVWVTWNGLIVSKGPYKWFTEFVPDRNYKFGFDLYLCARHCKIF